MLTRNLYILLGIILGSTIICCSSDNNSEGNHTDKKLIQITNRDIGGYPWITQNLIYDTDGNLTEITDKNNVVQTSYSYNSSNLLVKKVDYQYNDDQTFFEIIKNVSYNSENKISNIEELFNVYHLDGSLYYQNISNIGVTYGPDSMSSVFTNEFQGILRKVEYIYSHNLITEIKITQEDTVLANMVFAYDEEGNCVSGNGPYQPGLYDTNDINLSVTYLDKVKNPFFKTFFDFNVLYYGSSFYYIRELLVNEQGTKYPERIQWYQFENLDYREIIDYSFDSDGYIASKKINVFSTSPTLIYYTWK